MDSVHSHESSSNLRGESTLGPMLHHQLHLHTHPSHDSLKDQRMRLFRKRKVSRGMKPDQSALLYLVSINTSLARVPSCLNYLIEDKLEAKKLTGMKTAQMLATLSWSLSRPDLLSGPLINRRFLSVTDGGSKLNKPKNDSLTVMQWNVLSQAIGYHCDKFSTCNKSDILWDARKWKIIYEIAQYSPDVLCLQEVDRFYFVHSILQKIGYEGKFVPKPDSPCYHLKDNTGPDGCAIFYNTQKLTLLNTSSRVLQVYGEQSNQVALMCRFMRKSDGKVFSVATTHLKARKGHLLACVRNEQGKDLLDYVNEECSNNPLIITGDFNAESSEPVHDTMTSCMASAYESLPESHPRYPSNWTQRVNEEETKQTVDYIFYDHEHMKVTSLLDLHSPDLMSAMPNDQYPSDHLSIAASFQLL